jgi:anti-anti-sigma factor
MKLETEELDGGVLKVSLSGRMDIAGVDAIAVPFAALAATDNRRVIVDLSGIDFMASLGIRAIGKGRPTVSARASQRRQASRARHHGGGVSDPGSLAGSLSFEGVSPEVLDAIHRAGRLVRLGPG